MTVSSVEINEQRFEEPDLVVAPLSPTKTKAPELPQAKAGEPSTATSEEQDTAETEEPLTNSTVLSGPIIIETPGPAKPVLSEPTETADNGTSKPGLQPSPLPRDDGVANTSVDELVPDDIEKSRGLSPHPEDTPAPLFSVPLAPDSGVQQPPYNSEAGAAPAEAQPGEPSMNAAPPFDSTAETLEPVVGDFLKMQFVEHRVVPTILVCSPSLTFSLILPK